ncbi:MAG: DsrE family protein [Betaproteobacteria bacterium]
MMKSIWKLLFAAIFLGWFGVAGSATDEVKVLYHINDSTVARAALGNIRNHLNATEGKVKIVVVAHGNGVDFLLDGGADKNGNPYNITVEELMGRGVDFRVCNNTLKARSIDPKSVLPGAVIVPSGVAEIGRLQAKEGYVYIKP